MNIVDSSGWLEYFIDGQNADFFSPAIEDTDNLLVSVINIYEVFKRILTSQGLEIAEMCIADLLKGRVIDLTASISLSAASISAELKIPMADSLILATAYAYNAVLWSQDEHFEGLTGVQYISK
jgi:predicted nucleic acid-binding protein